MGCRTTGINIQQWNAAVVMPQYNEAAARVVVLGDTIDICDSIDSS